MHATAPNFLWQQKKKQLCQGTFLPSELETVRPSNEPIKDPKASVLGSCGSCVSWTKKKDRGIAISSMHTKSNDILF